MGGERQLKAFRKVGKVCVKEMNASEPLMKHRYMKQMCKSGFCQSLILTVIKVIAYRKSSILLKRMIRNMAIGICIRDSFFD